MTRLFLYIYRFFSAHKVVMYLVLGISTVVFAIFASRLHFDENIASLLPKRDESSEMEVAFEDVKVKDKIFLEITAADGSILPPDSLAAAMGRFAALCSEKDKDGLIGNWLYRLDDDDLMNALYYALGALPCHLGPGAYEFLDKHLNEAAIDSTLQAGTMAFLPEMGSFILLDGQFFTRDSTSALAFLSPAFSSLDTQACGKCEKLLCTCVRHFQRENPGLQILYHGVVIEGSFNSSRIKWDLLWTVGVSLLVICLIICISFKSRGTLFQLLAPVVYGCLLAMACMYWLKGTMSLIALGIGVIILGVAISYCLHVITHFKYVGDARTVIQEEARPVCLGCLTTIGAFTGLLFTSSELLKDFGIFASCALVGTTLFSLVFLPHFFRAEDVRKNERIFDRVNVFNSYPLDRNKPVVILLTLICVVCFCVSGRVGFDSNLYNIGYKEPKVVASEELYGRKVNGGHFNTYYAAHAENLDSAIFYNRLLCEKLDSMANAGLIYGYSSIKGLLVPEAEQRENIARWKKYWTRSKTERTYRLLRKELAKYDWDTGGIDVAETFKQMAQSDYEPQPLLESGAFPEALSSNFVEQLGDGSWLVFTGVQMDRDGIMAAGDEVATMPHIVVLDPFYYAGDMVKIVHNDFNVVLMVSSVFVFLVLLLSFKSLILAIIAFLPMGISWYVVKGMMFLSGVDFNLINIMISTFIFGIGVDYSIFVMEGLVSKARNKGYRLLLCHKSAIFFSGLILLIVVSSLLFARHPAIHSIGFSTIIGMVSTILITYALQPLLIRLVQKWPALAKKVFKI